MILVHIASVYFTKSVSVLTAIILGEPWLASFTEAKDNGSGGDSCKTCKAPVKSSLPTNQHPAFYRPDALPVTQSTVSKHSRVIVQKKIVFFVLYKNWYEQTWKFYLCSVVFWQLLSDRCTCTCVQVSVSQRQSRASWWQVLQHVRAGAFKLAVQPVGYARQQERWSCDSIPSNWRQFLCH